MLFTKIGNIKGGASGNHEFSLGLLNQQSFYAIQPLILWESKKHVYFAQVTVLRLQI